MRKVLDALAFTLVFWPWVLAALDLGTYALLGYTATDLPWGPNGRTLILLLWPISAAFVASFLYGQD